MGYVLVLLAYAPMSIVLSMQHSPLTLFPRETPCPNIEGNSDFYGLGIRIGIYLQWSSSWIRNSVNHSAAATNHGTNTIFLCALLISTAVAFSDGSLKLAEKYVLLLLSSGFFCTVLSFLGPWLRLLQHSSLKRFRLASGKALRKELADLRKTVRDHFESTTSRPQAPGRHNWYESIFPRVPRGNVRRIGFRPDSRSRHPAFSWAGVFFRSLVGGFLAVLNLLTWWPNPQNTADRSNPCVTTVYFFGARDFSGSLFSFFRVATILLTIPVGYLFLYSVIFIIRLISYGKNWLLRYGIIHISEFVSPGAWDRLDGRKRMLWGALIAFVTDSIDNLIYDPISLYQGLKTKRDESGRFMRSG